MVKLRESRSVAAPHIRPTREVILARSFPKLTVKVFAGEKHRIRFTSSSMCGGNVADVMRNGVDVGTNDRSLPSSLNFLRKLSPHCETQCASSPTIAARCFVNSGVRRSLENLGCSRHISGDVRMTWCCPFSISCILVRRIVSKKIVSHSQHVDRTCSGRHWQPWL